MQAIRLAKTNPGSCIFSIVASRAADLFWRLRGNESHQQFSSLPTERPGGSVRRSGVFLLAFFGSGQFDFGRVGGVADLERIFARGGRVASPADGRGSLYGISRWCTAQHFEADVYGGDLGVPDDGEIHVAFVVGRGATFFRSWTVAAKSGECGRGTAFPAGMDGGVGRGVADGAISSGSDGAVHAMGRG